MSSQETVKIQVSTDILGLRQNPEKFLTNAYPEDITYLGIITGMEAIAVGWPRHIDHVVKDLYDRTGIPVVRLHGRTGGDGQDPWDQAKLQVFENIFSPSTRMLLDHFPEQEILIHAPEAMDAQVFNSIVIHRAHTKKAIWIENHPEMTGMQDMKYVLRKLRKEDVSAKGMLDLVHIFRNEWKGLAWDDMLKQLDLVLQEKTEDGKFLINGIHFPIGTFKKDSLDLQRIDKSMLRSLATVLHRHGGIEVIELENQQNGRDVFSLHNDLTKRNIEIFYLLLETGIIPN